MAGKRIDFQANSTNVRINILRRITVYSVFSLLWTINNEWVKKIISTTFFAPRKYRTSDSEQVTLGQAQYHRINVNDQYISCWRWGTGPALLFIHGWNGSGIQFAPFIRDSLEKGYSVITFDGPGHGASEGRSSSYFEMTDAVRGVIHHFGTEEIVALIGHSFGASAIVNALHKEKYRIPAVLLAPALEIKEMLEGVFKLHGIPLYIYQQMIENYEERFGYDLQKDNPKNLIPMLDSEVLIVHDRQDKVTPFSESDQIATGSESIKLIPTDGLGHKKILFDREVIARIFQFLESILKREDDNN